MLNTDNNMEFFLSFLSLVGACVELDWAAQDVGFDEGFVAANWADECRYADEDGFGEGVDVLRFESFVTEQLRLMQDVEGMRYDNDPPDIDTGGHEGLGECEHCAGIYQNWNEHDCYGTRGEAAEARMLG